jgi:tRNA threonylcarbamoyladenosine biosynthesis protein TsaE
MPTIFYQPMIKTIITSSIEETFELARKLASVLPRPSVIALSGQLGAGKTHFIKGLGLGLGLNPAKVCSATFVLIAEYGDAPKLVHIDAYRFNDPHELEDIGWYELLEEPDTLIAVEWADKITTILPGERVDVLIEILDDHRRKFTLSPIGTQCTTAVEKAFPSACQ